MELQSFLVDFKIIVENCPDSIYLLDLSGNFIYANAATLKFLGVSSVDGKSISDVASSDNHHSFINRVEKMKNGETLSSVIIELPSKAIATKHVEINYAPIFDEFKNLIAVQGIARDITTRRQLEGDIFKIKNVLETIFDSITDEMFLLDREGIVIRANLAFLKKSGNDSFNQIIGKKCSEIYAGQEIFNSQVVDLCILSGNAQTSIQIIDSGKLYKEVHYYPIFDGSGKVMNVICYVKDISEKVLVETRLENQNKKLIQLQKIEKEMNGVLELNVLLKHILRGLEKFGFENSSLFLINEEEDSLEGIMSTSVEQDEMRKMVISISKNLALSNLVHNKQLISSKEPLNEEIMRDLEIDPNCSTFAILPLIVEDNVIGILKLTSMNLVRLSDEDLAISQFFANDAALAINRAVLYDKLNSFNKRLKLKIKEATTELMAKNVRLRQASQMKSQLLSIVSHELRTPLTSIKGYSSLFYSGKLGSLNDQQKECARIIDIESDRLKDVVNDVINLSNLVSGKDKLVLEECDMIDLIESTIAEFNEKANEKNISIVFNKKEISKIVADIDKIKTVVRNLISNAIKFNKIDGMIIVSISDETQFLEVSIRDTGIGIGKENIEKVFEEFVQLEKHLTRVGTGTGIGLSTAKEIIDLHNGDIWVESVPAKRTTFYFTIPKEIKTSNESKTETDVKRVVQELESIRAVSSIIHKDFELDHVIEIILQSIKHAIGFDRVRLYLTNKDNSVLQGISAIGTENIKDITVSIKNNTILEEIFSSKKAKIFATIPNSDVAAKLGKTRDLPFATMPLIVRGNVIGVVVADNVISNKKITLSMLESLTTFVNNAAITIENARLYGEMESMVEERTEKLQQLNAKLNEFMSYLSHELRTPLTSIIGYSKLLISKNLSEENKNKSAEIINTESVRLNQLIDDYLDLSKLEAGKMKPKIANCNLFDIVSNVVEILKPLSDKKKIILDIKGQNLFADIDPVLIKQALINLVHNGIKFTEKGSVTIELVDEKDNLKILVLDTGIGISEQDQEKVFDKFVQIQTKTDTKGTGLGMSITKHIVEAHEGSIKLKSELGKGTKVIITLPKKI